MIRIAIVDDQTIVRKSLKTLLEDFEDISVVLEESDGTKLLELLPEVEIDIVLLDVLMPVMDGFETCRILVRDYPHILIAILSGVDDLEYIRRAMEMGAHGYLSKNVEPDELHKAVLSLNYEGYYIEESLGLAFGKYISKENRSPKKTLHFSERQLQILRMGLQGFRSREIAAQLGISVKTIDIHKSQIMQKLEATTFSNAVFYALKNGIITTSELK